MLLAGQFVEVVFDVFDDGEESAAFLGEYGAVLVVGGGGDQPAGVAEEAEEDVCADGVPGGFGVDEGAEVVVVPVVGGGVW